MAWYGPSSAKTVPIRPLDKGMILNQPSQVIPDGAFVKLENFVGNQEGPYRRPGHSFIGAAEQCPYPILDVAAVWSTSGSLVIILITTGGLFHLTGNNLVEKAFVTETLTGVTVAGATVTGSGFLDLDILEGDFVRIGDEEAIVDGVADDLIVLRDATLTDGTGLTLEIVATFGPSLIPIPDYVVYDNHLIIADGKRPLIAYDPLADVVSYWVNNSELYPTSGPFVACCVTAFRDRIFAGYIKETGSDGIQRQRIRWSALANRRDFSIVTNYLDLPYLSGELHKLLPLGDSLMAYFSDGIFLGVPTNYPTLPVQFSMVETGGVGLTGKRAICSYLGGHFFVGHDDMYVIAQSKMEKVGTPISREALFNCTRADLIYATPDPGTFTICFGVPEHGDEITRIWRFDYRSHSWSYDRVNVNMLANPFTRFAPSWDDLPGTFDNLGDIFPSWDAILGGSITRELYVARGPFLSRVIYNSGHDNQEEITAILETKDHDLDDIDGLKTFVRMAIKIDSLNTITEPIVFNIEGSINRGRVWRRLGTLIIRAGYDEGYANFRMLGSTARFRLTTSSRTPPYYITEYSLRVRTSGQELDVSTQA